MYTRYQAAITSQLDKKPEDLDFKSNEDYRVILEHCSEQQGKAYLDEIKKHFSEFYAKHKDKLKDICQVNDKYGKTIKVDFQDFMSCSPSNLRYIFHALLILRDMQQHGLREVDIIEIGGGYGGLCLVLQNLAPLCNIRLNSYFIFDLVEASQLQKKYLDLLSVKNIRFGQIDNFSELRVNSYLISNYAFSEISKDLREAYTEKVLDPFTSHGFLAWNFIGIYKFVNNRSIQAEKEYPQTGGGTNYYVTFWPHN
jgi:hypothetical protein